MNSPEPAVPPADPVGEPRNRANVEALAAILLAVDDAPDPTRRRFGDVSAREFAARLAAFGVLVPAAMSEDDLAEVQIADDPSDMLARIARGEP